MGSKGFLMRMLPFLAAFTVAIFITSLFVDIKRPTFRGQHKRFHELRRENERLKNENLRLKNELEGSELIDVKEAFEHEWTGPEVPVGPTAPPPPSVKRYVRTERHRHER